MELNIRKLAEMVNYLVGKYNNRLNYLKLIKLLYIANKEAWKKWDVGLTNDDPVSMPKGPVFSNLYNFIMNKHVNKKDQNYWNRFFFTDKFDLITIGKNGQLPTGELSRREWHILDHVDSKYHNVSWESMINHVHDKNKFPEVEETNSSEPISLKDILYSVGRTEDEAREILEEKEQLDKEERFLKSYCE